MPILPTPLRLRARSRMWRGALAGERVWVAIAAVSLARRLMKKLNSPQSQIVYSEELLPGQSLVISNAAPPDGGS